MRPKIIRQKGIQKFWDSIKYFLHFSQFFLLIKTPILKSTSESRTVLHFTMKNAMDVCAQKTEYPINIALIAFALFLFIPFLLIWLKSFIIFYFFQCYGRLHAKWSLSSVFLHHTVVGRLCPPCKLLFYNNEQKKKNTLTKKKKRELCSQSFHVYRYTAFKVVVKFHPGDCEQSTEERH